MRKIKKKHKQIKRNRFLHWLKVMYLKCMCLLLKRNMCGTSSHHLYVWEKVKQINTRTRMEDKVRMKRMREWKGRDGEEWWIEYCEGYLLGNICWRKVHLIDFQLNECWARVTQCARCTYSMDVGMRTKIQLYDVHHIHPALHSFTLPKRIGMW